MINTKIKVGEITVKNRIMMPPMVVFGYSDESGVCTEKNITHYEDRAKAGAGFIVVEASAVSKTGRITPVELGVWDDRHIEGLAKVASVCKKHGATVILQIVHAGIKTHDECGEKIGPSSIENAREMSGEELEDIKNQFIEAGVRAYKAGFNGVQLHACHGYLLNTFANPTFNKRADEYGGSVKNRARLTCEILQEIKERCGKDFIVAVRMGGNDPDIATSKLIADEYINAGADMLNVSAGMEEIEKQDIEGYDFSDITYMGTAIREHINGRVPVSAVFGIRTPAQAREFIEKEYGDFVEIGKGMLADPEWSRGVFEGQEISPCVGCERCVFVQRDIDKNECVARLLRRKTTQC